jgi:Xaa-Pro dipeptidase
MAGEKLGRLHWPARKTTMFDLTAVQQALAELGLDGWLLYDFRGSNLLARRVLDLAERPAGSRRFYYFIPATGEPVKLVHRIEEQALDHLPGRRQTYLQWQQLEEALTRILAGRGLVAMEYSPRSANPYVARVDAGTVELVRSTGAQVVSSGDLVQLFEATWDDEQWEQHRRAAVHTDSAFAAAWSFIAERIRRESPVRESDVQQVILDHFARYHLTTYHPPIVAVGPHTGDPHYETTPATDTAMREGDFVLVDLWARLDEPRSVYSDLTRVGYIGREVPAQHAEVFAIVARARDAAIARVRQAFASGEILQGWQVDQAARDVIEAAGYGERFVHRTGHSIGQETHGNGANMDNLETHDERRVLRRTCFSVEPGIYLPEFGIRSEVNVFIDSAGHVHVTGGALQTEVLAILSQAQAKP